MGFASDMPQRLCLILLALLFTAAAHAQMYRWVDKQGRVHYTDAPPPPSEVKQLEEKKFGGNVVQGEQIPYATAQAARDYPVTLYTGDCGEACKAASALLSKRGIPFAARYPAKNPADLEAFKKVGTENVIPVLTVGSTTLKGYNEAQWLSALDLAGYPKSGTSSAATKPEAVPGKSY